MLDDAATGREPDPRAVAVVREHIRRYVRRVFRDLDADEIAQVVTIRLLERTTAAPSPTKAVAYVLAAARNAAIDERRRRDRRHEVPLNSGDDRTEDPLALLLERDASRAEVVAALRQHIEAGDATLVRVITAWLDLAEELRGMPSTRQVAERARVSHTTVATALRHFRTTLSAE